jgi:hypothetical protein
MKNIFENLGLVDNTSGMTSIQVRELGTILPDRKNISVLEFGAGVTTGKLYDALLTKYDNVNYVTYEDNPVWAPTNPGIEVRMFNRDDLINNNLKIPSNEKYDLIIVDGPDGELRKYWYPIFKNNVNKGTIIHVDDAFHYESFETELRNCFPQLEYVFEVGRDGWIITNKCWITAKVK